MADTMTIVEAPPPKPIPAPTRVLRPTDVANLPDAGAIGGETARQKAMRERLGARAKPSGIAEPPKESVKEPPKPAETTPPAKPEERPGAEPGEQQPTEIVPRETSGAEKTVDKPKKANPWKLFDEEKKARAAAEQEVQRLKAAVAPEQERGALTERVSKAEARVKELEDELRFVSYEKHPDFIKNFHQPYVDKIKDAMSLLSRIPVTDSATGEQRAANESDLFALMALDPVTQQKTAEELFGPLAGRIIAKADAVQDMLNARDKAIKDQKENGSLRDQQRREQFQRQQKELAGFVEKAWQEANDGFLADPRNGDYFKPKVIAEGKQPTPEEKEWNDALARGYTLVDEALKANVMNPKSTPEERKEAIKKLAAVKNRAAAFGPLKKLAKRLEARVAQLEKDLEQYSGSTPGAGGSATNDALPKEEKGMSRILSSLQKIAR